MAYYHLGIIKNSIRDFEGAISYFDKALDFNPNAHWAYHHRGISKSKLGDITAACMDWTKAGELGSDISFQMIKKQCNWS
jgi:tetratricopeptide (TPR) repeat protein